MAMYTLLFGHAEWPTEEPRRRNVSLVDEREAPERLSVKVPPALKRRVEASAELDGVSPNAWIVRALSRSVDPRLAR